MRKPKNDPRAILTKEVITGKEAGLAEIASYIYHRKHTDNLFTDEERATIISRIEKNQDNVRDYNQYFSCIEAVSRSISKMEADFQKAERCLAYIMLDLLLVERHIEKRGYTPYVVDSEVKITTANELDTFLQDKQYNDTLQIRNAGLAKRIFNGKNTGKEMKPSVKIPKEFLDMGTFIEYASISIKRVLAHAKAVEILADYIGMPELAKDGMPNYKITQDNAKGINKMIESVIEAGTEAGIDLGALIKYKKECSVIATPTLNRGYISYAKEWLKGRTLTPAITHILYLIVLNGNPDKVL